MIHALAALVLALPLTASAIHQDSSVRRRHADLAHKPAFMRRGTSYTIKDNFVGEDFLQWTFYTGGDPTHGQVNYVDADTAIQSGLATVDCNNVTTIAVDATQTVAAGGQRNSVRISSPQTYSSGLFIADFAKMPTGCSLWPAYWTLGTVGSWPQSGEIDIIEGVNVMSTNQITLHSSSGCSLVNQANTTARVLGESCASSDNNNAGCAYAQDDTRSFGPGFNAAGGGVYAHLWNADGITVWFFSRDSIPSDITSKNPDPSTWGTPTALFPSTGCDIASHFYDHSIVIDTTICGDWAGPAYASSGCPGSCSDAVANGKNFVDAQWKINYISVYE